MDINSCFNLNKQLFGISNNKKGNFYSTDSRDAVKGATSFNVQTNNMPPIFTEGNDDVWLEHVYHETYNALGGNDLLVGRDSPNCTYYGGSGNDWLGLDVGVAQPRNNPASNWNFLDGGEGNDILWALGQNGKTGIGNFLLGGVGNDYVNIFGQNYSEISGDDGNDQLVIEDSNYFRAFGGRDNDRIGYQNHAGRLDGNKLETGYVSGGQGDDMFLVSSDIKGAVDENGLFNLDQFKINTKGNIVLMHDQKEVEIEKDIEKIGSIHPSNIYKQDDENIDYIISYQDLKDAIIRKKERTPKKNISDTI